MLSSAAAALGQMFDRKFSGVLWLGVGCTFLLFVLLMFALQWAVRFTPDFGFSWMHDAVAMVSGFLLTIAFVFMGAPVAQMFAGIFTLGLLGYLINYAFLLIERHVLRWRGTSVEA